MSRDTDVEHEWGVGDRVRVDIPDETDPRHQHYHGRHGTIIATIPDSDTPTDADTPTDPDTTTDVERDDRSAVDSFRVEFDTEGTGDFTATELRPPITV